MQKHNSFIIGLITGFKLNLILARADWGEKNERENSFFFFGISFLVFFNNNINNNFKADIILFKLIIILLLFNIYKRFVYF